MGPESLSPFCLPTPITWIGPDGTVERLYVGYCPPLPVPDDVDLPDLPGIGSGEGETGEITDDPNGGEIEEPADDIPVGPEIAPGDQVQPQTHPQVLSKVREQADEDTCVEGCDQCAPLIEGFPDWNRYWRKNEWVPVGTWNGYHYQALICGLPHDPPGRQIVEIFFTPQANGKNGRYAWDGFEPVSCTLIDAKWGYDTLLEYFFRPHTFPNGTEGSIRDTRAIAGEESRVRLQFRGLVQQAEQQLDRLAPYPETNLLWSFASFDSYIIFQRRGGGDLDMFVINIPWSPA